MSDTERKRQLVDALHKMYVAGISPGASGNASVRTEDGMWISASGLSAGEASLSNLAFIADEGKPAIDGIRPSSEWHLHQQIYRDHPRCQAIVHCHSRHATALACLRRPIPAFHYMVAVAGAAEIPCTEYAEFGTETLANSVSKNLYDVNACLMANHGQIALGDSPLTALALAQEVEELAAMYLLSLQSGEPVLLSQAEMEAVLKRFASGYGQGTSTIFNVLV
ncbi:class II aldolase/adducin family protein [Spongiibacter sp. KMU-158]|uniref:Class II aldolase/adducin family protein n=1 Tax=Spongiibacter pelagi TaxID=2760804 RepID=A0A927C2I1_9GAMM|nr:class II aldolase/adducin family protein [Spongiibacter pelagi]MBD2859569.1 class II aldolase/adducin family protein [Spongiibacter pelagi]